MKRRLFVSVFVGSMVLALGTVTTAYGAESEAAAAAPAPAAKGPPLPFLTIEGYGGGAITPMAYLVNPAPTGEALGLPSVAFDAIGLGEKNLQAFLLTENLFGRVELGYGAERLYLGTLPNDIENATGVNINSDDVWLHNFNLRVLALPEGSFHLPLPALTVGAHFKYNNSTDSINSKLGGALTSIGYRHNTGEEFTLTATKMFTQLGAPLILTAGGRESTAEALGFLGFSNQWRATFEANAAVLPTSWLLLAYEFRQNSNPYKQIPGLIENADDWHAFDVGWIINSHATLVGGYGIFGTLANSTANNAWWLQVKYEL